MVKVYLAGPDVFLPDAMAHGRALQRLCAEYGFVGIYPLDGALPEPLTATPRSARHIYEANIALLADCDAVMANLQNFRGTEPDSGTAFEVGFAVARGLPVWGYGAPSQPITAQVAADAAGRDAEGFHVEDFGLSRNLMLACSIQLVDGDVQACLAAMRNSLLRTD
jgi:nucleoside 2-deoxyribosyltransferase